MEDSVVIDWDGATCDIAQPIIEVRDSYQRITRKMDPKAPLHSFRIIVASIDTNLYFFEPVDTALQALDIHAVIGSREYDVRMKGL